MKKEIKIPDIAENVDSGIVAGILVSKGDTVTKDQSVIEVETDKAATDIPSPYDGKVEEIKVEEGDEVNVGQVVIVLEVSGEGGNDENEGAEEKKEDQDASKEDEAENEKPEEQTDDEDPEKMKDAEEDHEEEAPSKGNQSRATDRPGEDIPASPSVRRLARESGVDLANIEGTGSGNRITREDVEKAADKQSGSASNVETKEADLPDFSQWGGTHTEKMNNIKRITAQSMTESWQQIPQVTQFDEADITAIEEFRQKHKDDYEKSGGKLTVTAILVKIIAFALQRYPLFNSSIDMKNSELVMKHYTNIGVAVDTDKGLLVPVIKDVDKKSLEDISVETVELAKKARENKISPDEMKGGNFTISNLGGIGGTGFTPIVYSPQVAILGVSKASYKPVYQDEDFIKRLVLPLTLTYDHRVIDGADGARFLRWICDVLEDPFALLK